MTINEVKESILEIEKDITYFNNLGFDHIKDKFTRDLNIIKSLLTHIDEKE